MSKPIVPALKKALAEEGLIHGLGRIVKEWSEQEEGETLTSSNAVYRLMSDPDFLMESCHRLRSCLNTVESAIVDGGDVAEVVPDVGEEEPSEES